MELYIFYFLSVHVFILWFLLFTAAHHAVGYVTPVYSNMPLVPAKLVPLSS